MRLFLLPISTRRTLIYCQRLNVALAERQTWLDKGTSKAATLWSQWEKKESGWQKRVVEYGGQALKRIPFEEWGLKSIPPLSARRRKEELAGKDKIEVSFPPSLIPEDKVTEVLRRLGTERQSLHRKRMIWSFIAMPITAPAALVPLIPNIPFFYLVFRAWSHWKALSGSKHVEFLLDQNLIAAKPSRILDELYSTARPPQVAHHDSMTSMSSAKSTDEPTKEEESLVLDRSAGKKIAEALELPELNVEFDRAIWQVEKALKAENDLKPRKAAGLDTVNLQSKEKK